MHINLIKNAIIPLTPIPQWGGLYKLDWVWTSGGIMCTVLHISLFRICSTSSRVDHFLAKNK